jgi:hypothetical protein
MYTSFWDSLVFIARNCLRKEIANIKTMMPTMRKMLVTKCLNLEDELLMSIFCFIHRRGIN